jgi:hypothetical protein
MSPTGIGIVETEAERRKRLGIPESWPGGPEIYQPPELPGGITWEDQQKLGNLMKPPKEYAGGLGQGYLTGFDTEMPQLHGEIGRGLGGWDVSSLDAMWENMLKNPGIAFRGGVMPDWVKALQGPKTRPGGPEFMPPRPKVPTDYQGWINRLLTDRSLSDYMVNYILRRVRGEKIAEPKPGGGTGYIYFDEASARKAYPPPPRSIL